jgi:hypothetical protein
MTPTRTRPLPGVMIGLSHDGNATPLIRAVKSTRVGIGIPKGPAVLVYITGDAADRSTWTWRVMFGKWVPKAPGSTENKFSMVEAFSALVKFLTTTSGALLPLTAEVESFYRSHRHEAADPGYPNKISFFTFTRKSVISEAKKVEEFQEPDFAAIAAHGPMPKEIDILLMDENPLLINEYAMYSKSEKQCYGDGEVGMRVLALAKSPEEKKLADEAKAANERYFPVLNGCATSGCGYYGAGGCKPSLTMAFQLMNSLRIGSTAFFTTTAINSSWKINSGIADLRSKTRSIAGKPVKLCVSPIRTNHIDPKTQKAMPGLSYGVHIELRAEDIETLKRILSAGWLEQEAPRAITAAAAPLGDAEELTGQTAADVAGEFYVERDEDEVQAESAPPPAAATSAAKVADVEARIREAKATPPAQPAATTQSATQDPVSAPAQPTPIDQPRHGDPGGPTPLPTTRWADKRAMNAEITDLKKKLGDIEFSKLQKGTMIGILDYTTQKAVDFVDSLKARYAEMVRGDAPAAPTPAPVAAPTQPVAQTPTPAAAAPDADPDRLF